MTKVKSVPVASIKSLAGEAATFPLTVKIKHLNGNETEFTLTAKAMRKSEWAALRDEQINIARSVAESVTDAASEPAKFSWASAVGDDMRKFADLITKCATGWDFEEAFNQDSLIELEDMFGGTLANVLQSYDAAIFHGRLGNSA